MSQRTKQTSSNWYTYERGRTSSVGSLRSIDEGEAQNDNQGSAPTPPTTQWYRGSDAQDEDQTLRNRRSSVFNSLRQMGGVNNIDNFARSFQRAQAFRTITPIRRGSISYSGDGDDGGTIVRTGSAERPMPNKSLLRAQLEAAQEQSPEIAVSDTPQRRTQSDASESSPLLPTRSHERYGSASLAPRYGNEAELGTSFGSISGRLTGVAQRRASILIQQHIEASLKARELQDEGEDTKDDLVERRVEVETREDGEVIERIVGESTVPMTIFNSINVLIGIGILALPLAMKYTGWVLGLILITLPAVLTNYTAKLLAKCLDTNSGSTTYGDLAYLAFGEVGRTIVEAIFVVELLGANIAMLILFGDSMYSLVPILNTTEWKAFLAIILIPLNFVPFKYLSLTSILGIICTLGIVLIAFVDGFLKTERPGSLINLMPTHAFPQNWYAVPLSIGLFTAPWGGHSVFPAVYKDMRHPQKYGQALTYTYLATYGLDLTMAVFGYLMFGNAVRDEVSTNILLDPAYPKVLSVIMVILVCVIPITKIPLSNRPIADTVNKKFMIDLRQMDAKARKYSEKSWKHRIGRVMVGSVVNIAGLLLAILIPDFDSIMSSLGASVCLLICAILPIAFYVKIFSSDGMVISRSERIMDYVLIVVVTIIAIIGTVFACIPKAKLGVKPCEGIACLG